ncbi:MAG: LPP20 family lipoprotein [Treponema sp.]|nr:LPP20 family lipoprotein [Treponema sp.]
MKAAKIFNIKRIKNKFLFLSLLLCTFSCFAKGEPEWFLNWRTVYPNEKYIAQRGSGENAEKARTDALSQIARYFQTTVNANLTTTMQSVTSENSISENTTVIDEVSVLSQVELFAVEYTEGYYYKKEKKWYSVAFIERSSSWTQFKPQVDMEKNTFNRMYQKACGESEPLEKLKSLKTAFEQGKILLQKLEYARIINPAEEEKYAPERNCLSEIPAAFSEEKAKCRVYVSVPGDYSRIITAAVTSSFGECGFSVAKSLSEASHIAEVLIEDNAEGTEPVSIIPAISLKLTGKETGQTVFSFEAESKEKTVSYTLENAKKKAYPKLAGELKAGIKNNLGTAFAL